MSSVNKVILLGRLGGDPEVRYTTSDTPVAGFSVATSYRSKGGEEVTEWHRCIAWDKLATVVVDYAKKGHLIYIEGRLRTRRWEDRDGNERQATEVIVERVQLIGKTVREDGGSNAPRAVVPAKRPPQAGAESDEGIADMDDDVPF